MDGLAVLRECSGAAGEVPVPPASPRASNGRECRETTTEGLEIVRDCQKLSVPGRN